MKLFTPVQAKAVSTTRMADDVAQIAYLTVELRKLEERMNTEQNNFTARMSEQRAVYEEEKARLQDELKKIEQKIVLGERRLVELLVPVDNLTERASETLSRSQIEGISIMTREENLIELEELFKEKMDMVTEREARAYDTERKLQSRVQGAKEEAEMISRRHTQLNEAVLKFNEDKSIKEKYLEERENSIIAREIRNTEYLDLRTKELDEEKRALADKRAALDRAFEEITRLKNNKNNG